MPIATIWDRLFGPPTVNQYVPDNHYDWLNDKVTQDPTGYFVDSNGNPVNTPVNTPSLLGKIFRPQTTELANQANFNYQMMPVQAQQAENTQNKIMSERLGTLGQSRWLDPTASLAQNSIYARYNPLTPEGALSTQTSEAELANNTPEARAKQALAEANANIQESNLRTRGASARGLYNIPENAAAVESQGLGYQSGQYGGLTALQPSQFKLMGLQTGNDIQQQEALRERLPFQTSAELSEAEKQAALAGTSLGMVPAYQRGIQNEALSGAYNSSMMTPGMPVVNRINPDNTISLLQHNPGGMPSMWQNMAALTGQTSPMGAANNQVLGKTSSGMNFVAPVQSQRIDPLTGMPASNRPSIAGAGVKLSGDYYTDEQGNLHRTGERPLGQKSLPQVTLSKSLGGDEADAFGKESYPAITKEQMLQELGFQVNERGQLEEVSAPKIVSEGGPIPPVSKNTPEYKQRLQLALKVANMK